jgi:hypothetical protein
MSDLFAEKFPRWFCGNEAACAFASAIWQVAQDWDDMHDEGKRSNEFIAWLAFGKEYTPFFAAHADVLRPALLSMYLQWEAANILEDGDRNDVDKAFMLRAGIYSVFQMIAWLCGGNAWAIEVGPEIYRFYGETPQSLWEEKNNA